MRPLTGIISLLWLIARQLNRCYRWFCRTRSQHWKVPDQILDYRNFHNEESFHSWYSLLVEHCIAYFRDITYILICTLSRRDVVSTWLPGRLGHLSVRANEIMRSRYIQLVVHTSGTFPVISIPIKRQGTVALESKLFTYWRNWFRIEPDQLVFPIRMG